MLSLNSLPSFNRIYVCYFSSILLFVSDVLLIFIALSCYGPSNTFSSVYLIRSPANYVTGTGVFSIGNLTGTISSGYFNECWQRDDVTTCSRTSQAGYNLIATKFSGRVVKPYLLILSIVVGVLSFLSSILCLKITRLKPVTFALEALTLFFALLTGIWQEVAVHEAITLLYSVTKGFRASAMIWTAVSFYVVSTAIGLSEFWLQYRRDGTDDDTENPFGDRESIGKPYISSPKLGPNIYRP